MNRQFFVLIGGVANGDYKRLHRLAESGGTVKWSSHKNAQPGDRVLIYIQNPHSRLVAQGEVLQAAVKGALGDWAYRAKIGQIQILPNQLTILDLKREFPHWRWLRYPRSKVVVPERYTDQLLNLVHKKQSALQILISNAKHGLKQIHRLAGSGRSAWWPAPKLTVAGDTVLFYVEKPVSAIIAAGRALSGTRTAQGKWYQAKIGEVKFLGAPIPLAELRKMFPDWAWLRSMNMFTYVSQQRAQALLSRCALTSPKAAMRPGGAGFGDSRANRLVEQAAVRKVRQHLKRLGYLVTSRERDDVGYDLDARKGRTELHVEVKGVSGTVLQFPITKNEVACAQGDPAFRLMAVVRARTRQARIFEFKGAEFKRKFRLTPISFLAASQ